GAAMCLRFCSVLLLVPLLLVAVLRGPAAGSRDVGWKKHVIHSNGFNTTVAAADFIGDGKGDVISPYDGKVHPLPAPAWNQSVSDDITGIELIHSAVLDVNGDGRPDFIGASYNPGQLFWLECPAGPTNRIWKRHLIDDQLNGTHGLLVGDVDGDGKPDLV